MNWALFLSGKSRPVGGELHRAGERRALLRRKVMFAPMLGRPFCYIMEDPMEKEAPDD